MYPATTISERALLKRINRKLAKEGEKLCRLPERSRSFGDMGEYHLIEVHTNSVIATHVDVTKLAKEMQALGESETVAS